MDSITGHAERAYPLPVVPNGTYDFLKADHWSGVCTVSPSAWWQVCRVGWGMNYTQRPCQDDSYWLKDILFEALCVYGADAVPEEEEDTSGFANFTGMFDTDADDESGDSSSAGASIPDSTTGVAAGGDAKSGESNPDPRCEPSPYGFDFKTDVCLAMVASLEDSYNASDPDANDVYDQKYDAWVAANASEGNATDAEAAPVAPPRFSGRSLLDRYKFQSEEQVAMLCNASGLNDTACDLKPSLPSWVCVALPRISHESPDAQYLSFDVDRPGVYAIVFQPFPTPLKAVPVAAYAQLWYNNLLYLLVVIGTFLLLICC
jgi:hypothetical protein